jgi:hypothetical protein
MTKKNVGQGIKPSFFQGFLWGGHFDEHSEEKSRKGTLREGARFLTSCERHTRLDEVLP